MAQDTEISTGDTIATAANGIATVVMGDGASILLQPASTLKVESYAFVPSTPATNSLVLRLIEGVARVVSGAIQTGFQFFTPNAVLGIRGTNFTVTVTSAGTTVTVISGTVIATNSTQTFTLNAGESAFFPNTGQAVRIYSNQLPTQLRAGRYQFAMTYLDRYAQESGASVAGFIDLPANGGIRLTALEVPTDPRVTAKVIYFSKCNDDKLFRAGILPPAATTFTYQMEGPGKVPLITQHLRPAPAGQIVETFNGRSLVAKGNVLFYSEPYSLELFDPRKNFQFESTITLVSALDNGVFLGTESEVVWLSGTTCEAWSFAPGLAYGAVLGASTKCSRDMILDGQGKAPVAVFGTKYGLCLGLDGGEIVNLTQERYLYPIQPKGCAVVRRHRGFVQALVSFQGSESSVIETVGQANPTLPMLQLNS